MAGRLFINVATERKSSQSLRGRIESIEHSDYINYANGMYHRRNSCKIINKLIYNSFVINIFVVVFLIRCPILNDVTAYVTNRSWRSGLVSSWQEMSSALSNYLIRSTGLFILECSSRWGIWFDGDTEKQECDIHACYTQLYQWNGKTIVKNFISRKPYAHKDSFMNVLNNIKNEEVCFLGW